ncbi:hypothetical protein PIB30_065481 [Stylosanthes scabra]|uniref:F-box associated domain-containing protein n=1 Tax=Stylosanthes scabra TaxID=79078 RepID=A0ABU6QLX7_9FABA|nr:hypothetical protein [Stylosanthes scabra]
MSVKKESGSGLPYLGDDVLFKIFVKCHPKTVGRLRALSKFWSKRLTGKLFVEQNWKENEDRDPPVKLVEYGYFVIIGYDRGNMCIRCSEIGEVVKVIVWNLLTQAIVKIEDQARNYWGYSVSVYAFGYLDESWEYRVVYLYKKLYQNSSINWIMWNSIHRCWNHFGEYQTDIRKVGPTSVVVKGVIYWIGWCGFFNLQPTHVVAFSLDDASFFEDPIPAENLLSFHNICSFNKGLGFIAYQDVGLDREVSVWSLSVNEEKKFVWEKTIYISSFGIPYSPNILKGLDIISVLDTRSTATGSNDEQRTEVVISKRKNIGGNRSIIHHHGWQMSIFVKSYTMHRDGLFDI